MEEVPPNERDEDAIEQLLDRLTDIRGERSERPLVESLYYSDEFGVSFLRYGDSLCVIEPVPGGGLLETKETFIPLNDGDTGGRDD